MNYYDEEITVNGPETRQHLGNVKVDRLPSSNGSIGGALSGLGGSARRGEAAVGGTRTIVPGNGERSNRAARQRNMLQGNSTDDDGLLQDIIDHDDEDDDDDDDDDDDEDDSDMQHTPSGAAGPSNQLQARHRSGGTPQLRPQTRPGSTRILNLPSAKVLAEDTEASETESDEGVAGALPLKRSSATAAGGHSASAAQLNLTPEHWEQLAVPPEVKELFPYILKYTPQHIETPFHLQPFIPEFVPAVGDVDAFLKVTNPALLQPQRQNEVNEHLRKMGLFLLDEPSGEQSVPSLLNMKLRSVLTGSGVNARSASAALIPTAKSPKDIDKWIAEVEQVHMAQSIYDAQPRKDIEPLLLDWPRAYADAGGAIQDAYQRCRQEDISLTDYIRVLCERFGVEGAAETQADYILNVQTLFALYLAANQAWE